MDRYEVKVDKDSGIRTTPTSGRTTLATSSTWSLGSSVSPSRLCGSSTGCRQSVSQSWTSDLTRETKSKGELLGPGSALEDHLLMIRKQRWTQPIDPT